MTTWRFVVVTSVLLSSGTAMAAARCESKGHGEVLRLRAAVRAAHEDLSRDPAPALARIVDEARALVARDPDDWEAQTELLTIERMTPRGDRRDALKAAAQAPDAPAMASFVYGWALAAHRLLAAEALVAFERTLERDPGFAPAHLGIARANMMLDKKDEGARAARAWLAACPDSALGLRAMYALPGAEATRWLRARLPSLPPDERAEAYQTLWRLSFKETPPAKHAALRAQVGAELDALGRLPRTLPLLDALAKGAALARDEKRLAAVREEITARFPRSSAAYEAAKEADEKAHPAPAKVDAKTRMATARERLARRAEWVARWPFETDVLMQRFVDLVEINASPAELEAIAPSLLALAAREPMLAGMVARELIARGVRLDDAARLFESSRGAFAKRMGADRLAPNAAVPPDVREMLDEERRVEAGTLLRLRARQGRRAELRAALAELEALVDAAARGKSDDERRDLELERFDARAIVAEAEGRKADALAWAFAARGGDKGWVESVTATAAWRQGNPVRLWRELGGTPEAWAALVGAAGATEAKAAGWQEASREPFPAFTLQDLSGRTWRSTELRGKTLLVNFWATWCEPCKAELPHLEALAASLRDQRDVVVLAVNLDDDVGLVAPFVEAHRMKVPVVLGRDPLDRLASRGIPYNVIVDKQGRMRFELRGMDERLDWAAAARAKLAAAAR